MGIRVECPHGHVFKVKDKYAGKRGLCPHCKGQVEVRVPNRMSDEQASDVYRKAVIQEHRAAHAAPPVPDPASESSIFDDHPAERDSNTSGSLLGSSVIRHNIKCDCGASVPMWYARCPSCGKYIER
ncbi:MAG: hypothetical protein AAGJ46_04875 [Planctomycetota bacterium]